MPYGSIDGPHWAGMYMQRHMASTAPPKRSSAPSRSPSASTRSANPTKPSSANRSRWRTTSRFAVHRQAVAAARLRLPGRLGSALIFTTEERARDLRQKPVFFESWAMGTTRRATSAWSSEMTRSSPYRGRRACGRAPISSRDVDTAGLYEASPSSRSSGSRRSASASSGESGRSCRRATPGPTGPADQHRRRRLQRRSPARRELLHRGDPSAARHRGERALPDGRRSAWSATPSAPSPPAHSSPPNDAPLPTRTHRAREEGLRTGPTHTRITPRTDRPPVRPVVTSTAR